MARAIAHASFLILFPTKGSHGEESTVGNSYPAYDAMCLWPIPIHCFSLRFSATLRCAKLMPAEIQRTDSLVTEAMAKKFDNESFENPL